MNKVHFATKDVQIRDSGKVINNMLFKVFESVILGDVCGHFDFFARQRSELSSDVLVPKALVVAIERLDTSHSIHVRQQVGHTKAIRLPSLA